MVAGTETMMAIRHLEVARARDVAGLVDRLFKEHWRALHVDRWDDDKLLRFPGVCLLAYGGRELDGQMIKIDDVYYVGMSNSAGGVRARLKQFKSALEKGRGHSGGNRCYKQNDEKPFSTLRDRKKFHYAALCLECSSSVKSCARPCDFRTMGDVASLEYYAIAHFQEHSAAKKVPPLNRSAGGMPTV
jgi:hypothetical protein